MEEKREVHFDDCEVGMFLGLIKTVHGCMTMSGWMVLIH